MTERLHRIVVARLPTPNDRRELLELVLAAASLDLRVQVVLRGDAGQLLAPGADSGWWQLLDEGLAEVLVECSPDDAAGLPAGALPVRFGGLGALPAADTEIRA